VPIYAFTGSLTRPAPQYGAANGRGITSFRFDDVAGRLEPVAEMGGIDDIAWLTIDAARLRLYATCEIAGSSESAIASYAVDPATGALSLLGRQTATGGEACHGSFSPVGRFLLLANYIGVVPDGGLDNGLSVFPIGDDGVLGPAVASARLPGSGPNAGRQLGPHAHCVITSPNGRFVYLADLGIDRIVVHELGPDGSLTRRESSDLVVSPGLGPRHIVFRSDGTMMFMVSELIATVLAIRVDPETGALTQVGEFAISGEKVQPAGISLTADDRFLFVSLRLCNEILGLSVDATTGALTETGRWSSRGVTPRDFALSPSQNHMLVANQDSDSVMVFRVDRQAGTLSGPIQELRVGTPMSIKLADFPAA
jgi:6-phosphogluconolactonase